jgi:predicted nucleic acid-binding protein
MNDIKQKIKKQLKRISNLQTVELQIYQSILDDLKEQIEIDIKEGDGLEPHLFDVAFNDCDFDLFWDRFINKNV